MRVGTKSVLYGFHQPLIHSWFVAAAWAQLEGFPLDPRLWIAFFIHDLGYWGKPNMDGEEGERHPEFAAKVMSIFGKDWSDFVLLHSRFYAAKMGKPTSRLCVADKLAVCLTPRWLWRTQILLTGEWKEYITAAKYGENVSEFSGPGDLNNKYEAMCKYLRAWVQENR